MSVWDVAVDKARYCPDCKTVTNAVTHCLRCRHTLLPLDRFFRFPFPKHPQVEYRIQQGHEEFAPGEGHAYYVTDCPLFPQPYSSQVEAHHSFTLRMGTRGILYPQETFFDRIEGAKIVIQLDGGEIFVIVERKKVDTLSLRR